MKKIYIFFLFFLFTCRVYAINDIRINNSSLIPMFSKDVFKYNYFTTSDSIIIDVDSIEEVSGSGYHKLEDGKNIIVISSEDEEYTINVFKNYNKNTPNTINNITVSGYDINFEKDNHEYYLRINDEDSLDIILDTSLNASIVGNGNFNSTDNIISIMLGDEEYTLHALKSINTVYVDDNKEEEYELSFTSKKIVILLIITISCILVFIFFYSLFIFN